MNNTAQYETTIILTPEKSDSEAGKLAKGYAKFLKTNGAKVIHEDSWGLKNLAYPIRNKNTGYYFTMEYEAPTDLLSTLELNLKRDESILRFLSVKLDKYAVDYNDRKRRGLIGRDKVAAAEQAAKQTEKIEQPEIAEEQKL